MHPPLDLPNTWSHHQFGVRSYLHRFIPATTTSEGGVTPTGPSPVVAGCRVVRCEAPITDVRAIVFIKVPTADARGDVEWVGVIGACASSHVTGLGDKAGGLVPPGGIPFSTGG